MNNRYLINILNKQEVFEISGEISVLLKNKILLISFNRLKYFMEENRVFIPFSKNTTIQTLQKIESIFKKFGLKYEISKDIETELSTYKSEITNFLIHLNLLMILRNF